MLDMENVNSLCGPVVYLYFKVITSSVAIELSYNVIGSSCKFNADKNIKDIFGLTKKNK